MKFILKIIMLTVLSFNMCGQKNTKLYPIVKGDLWGYIDSRGETVIQSKYRSAGQFSEGLAAVRLNGTYGYINVLDSFTIKPQFDFALPFQNGQAKVFLDGKPYYIDEKGTITFQHNFKSISSFYNGSIAIAITPTDKYCLINKKGKLITDTVFKKIYPFSNGVSIVNGLNHLPYPKDSTQVKKFETGVIDSGGKWMVQYGKYKDIGSFQNGYATAARFYQTSEERSWSHNDAIIDKKGNLKFTLPPEKYFLDYSSQGFYEDLAVVHIYPEKRGAAESYSDYDKRKYKGVINTDGTILFSDSSWKEITPFTFSRAFVKKKNDQWILINREGKQVCDSTFKKILYKTYNGNPEHIFSDGEAWVKLTSGWASIDTNGRILSQPNVFAGVHDSRLSRVGKMIFINEDISIEHERYSFRYGFWNSSTGSYVSPTYHDIDRNSFKDDLIYAMKDGLTYYIDPNGKIIWKGSKSKVKALKNLNIDFMNRGYFYAYSKPKTTDLGGFGGSRNHSKEIINTELFQTQKLSLVVDPELKDTLYKSINAITVYIGNTTNNNIEFNAQDSRLYMKVQALNSKNEWKDIEYLPSSWCGNSYHTLTLEPKYFWAFHTPVYEGEYKTKLRIALTYIDPADKSSKRWEKKELTIYSNEYDGSINPGQFWNKREYYPSGIMDPYND